MVPKNRFGVKYTRQPAPKHSSSGHIREPISELSAFFRIVFVYFG